MSSRTAHCISAYHATRAFRNEDAGDSQKDADAQSSRPFRKCNDGELGGKGLRVAASGDCVLCGPVPIRTWISRHSFTQMIFDFHADAVRERAIETEHATAPVELLRNHAGLPRGPAPARSPPIASENRCQTARRSISARAPRRVSA